MTRPTASLRHHLLTRTDLEQLGIHAERVRTWLARGWLDQVGSLATDPAGEPIFAVLSRPLRDELGGRLLELGKDTVVFTPQRVRSLLARAMQLPLPSGDDDAPAVKHDAMAEVLLDPTMAEALRRVACSLEDEVELLAALAREEARLEALDCATQTAAEANFFVAAELEEELGLWEPLDAPNGSDETTAAASLPLAADHQPAEAAPPDFHEEETMSEPTLHPEDAEAVERTTADALDALFGPDEPATRSVSTEAAATADTEALEVELPPLDAAPSAEVEFAEPAADEPRSTEEPEPTAEVPAVAEVTSVLAMQRVESFLGELRNVLVELAQRPAAPPIDVQPLVDAVHRGFADLSAQAKANDTTLTAVTDRLGQFGDKLEHGAALAVHAALGAHGATSTAAAAVPAAPSMPAFVAARPDHSTAVLYAIGFLLLCWSGILWFKTGSTPLAVTTLVGANLIGCCVLVGRSRT